MFLRDLHVVSALLLAAFLTVTATTAALILSKPAGTALATLATSGTVEPSSIVSVARSHDGAAPASTLSWQSAIERAQRAFPKDQIMQVRPVAAGRRAGVVFYARGVANPHAVDIAVVDRQTGALQITENSRAEGPEGWRSWLIAIHGGFVLGPVRWAIMAIVGLGLVTLAVTGPLYWLRRNSKRKAKRADVRAAAAETRGRPVSIRRT